ncbi:hypothetical protein [Spongiibacter sp. UBA1325]|uniref:hypothetical protein n=1 Tax=Spongiibacter sp. UBA1325 TaxID=1947543 RepID=UPI002579E1C3|nr:hypothetical protein [Spongiibacter sp. UBA1325]|tara:strand:+ start:2097 stop:2327 length:231 start_codon:yes stop_codon:yes gene_type:complete
MLIPERMTPGHMARLMELLAVMGDSALSIAAIHMGVSVLRVRDWIAAAERDGLLAWGATRTTGVETDLVEVGCGGL